MFRYTREALQEAVSNSTSYAGVMRYLGRPPAGGTHAHLSRRIKREGIDTSHFLGSASNRGKQAANRLTSEAILKLRPRDSGRVKPHLLRRALVEAGVPYECEACGLGNSWNDLQLVLHVDHINGNHWDSRKENLRFLCPNCHSQTASWAGRNRWNHRRADYGSEADSA